MQSLDKFISVFDTGLRTVFAPAQANRACPKPESTEPTALTAEEKKQAAALMRINHVGEVCAQALYAGQALVSKEPAHVQALKQASQEEVDHLAWCEQRIAALGGRKSLLNPLWFAGSFGLGMTAGLLGERWNLGFLAETEHQVSAHLQSHLSLLPTNDIESRAVVTQMKLDEESHAETATLLGGAPLPASVKSVMRLASRLMTRTAYYV